MLMPACSGYFVNNEYLDEEYKETPPTPPRYDRLMRKCVFTSFSFLFLTFFLFSAASCTTSRA